MIPLFVWPAQRSKMLQCLLIGEIPLLFSTSNDDVLKRRFSIFSETFSHTKITFGKLLLLTFTVYCSLLPFIVLFTQNFAYLRGLSFKFGTGFFLRFFFPILENFLLELLRAFHWESSLFHLSISYYLTIL